MMRKEDDGTSRGGAGGDGSESTGRGRGGPDGPTGQGGGPGGGGGGAGPGGPKQARNLFSILLLLGLLLTVMVVMTSTSGRARQISWSEFRNLHQSKDVIDGTIVVRDSVILAKAKSVPGTDGSVRSVEVQISPNTKEFYVKQLDELTGGRFKEAPSSIWQGLLFSLLPFALLILLLWFLISRGLRSAAGGGGGMLGSFGKSRHRTLTKEMTNVTFSDVAGIDEAKEEVTEIIEFLKNPKKFMRLGGRIPRGVLLIGEPGCGKTLLAKAIAGEADVPFFSISGSDFVEMFVGVGASRVRDLFKQAKDSSPCIIFLDEIDAVGRRRGGGFTTGGHDEREQTLNAILVEMDGFNSADGVIVIAATNRADVLDPALTRPGRFDRQITVPRPDVRGRLEILRVHAKKVKLGPVVDLERIARATPMFSGADLAALINEAAIAATLHNKDFIEQDDLEEARDKVKFGRAKKSRVREKDENKLVAFHEAGHAVLQALLPDADPLHKVTIIARGDAGGATFSLPTKDRMGYSAKWLNATLRVLCGGRIAEARAMEDTSSGASADISQATQIARTMVLEWGMSPKLGFIRYTGADTREMYLPEKDYSQETARVIDEEIRRIVDEAYRDADRILTANWEKVVAVADALVKHETLSADEVFRLVRGETLTRPTVADLLAAEAKRSAAVPGRPADKTEEPGPDLPPGAVPTPA
ncbi:MAG: ATP-dependent zinc metalloprotease FtsH [Phycisphaeraceae bacterium]|nr:ATP-dependent zinc metalloprotease FtsH [Phycisphaeraceae bacterium]